MCTQPLLKLYQTKINPIVVAAALSKVVEAQRMWPAYAKEQAKVGEVHVLYVLVFMLQ